MNVISEQKMRAECYYRRKKNIYDADKEKVHRDQTLGNTEETTSKMRCLTVVSKTKTPKTKTRRPKTYENEDLRKRRPPTKTKTSYENEDPPTKTKTPYENEDPYEIYDFF